LQPYKYIQPFYNSQIYSSIEKIFRTALEGRNPNCIVYDGGWWSVVYEDEGRFEIDMVYEFESIGEFEGIVQRVFILSVGEFTLAEKISEPCIVCHSNVCG
jgi:hypothetical protein